MFKCIIFILNIFLDFFSCSKPCFCYHFHNIIPLIIIATPIVILLLYSSNPHPLDKGQQGLDVFKINGFSKFFEISRLKFFIQLSLNSDSVRSKPC